LSLHADSKSEPFTWNLTTVPFTLSASTTSMLSTWRAGCSSQASYFFSMISDTLVIHIPPPIKNPSSDVSTYSQAPLTVHIHKQG
jgi:hypothetical protein